MKEQIDKIKKHIKDHKEVYITGTVCVVVGSMCYTIGKKNPHKLKMPEFVYKPMNHVTQTTIYLRERSIPSKPVHMVGTERYFDSINDAARKTGHSQPMISRNVNGKIQDVKGDVFELLIPTA